MHKTFSNTLASPRDLPVLWLLFFLCPLFPLLLFPVHGALRVSHFHHRHRPDFPFRFLRGFSWRHPIQTRHSWGPYGAPHSRNSHQRHLFLPLRRHLPCLEWVVEYWSCSDLDKKRHRRPRAKGALWWLRWPLLPPAWTWSVPNSTIGQWTSAVGDACEWKCHPADPEAREQRG